MRRNLAYLIAFVVLIGTASFAVDSASAQGSESQLSGFICSVDYPGERGNYCAGSGLADASVTLTDPDGGLLGQPAEQSTSTDSNGQFIISGLSDGDYELLVERAGFESHAQSIVVAGKTFVEVSLDGKTVTQQGSVVDEDGAAVAGALIRMDGYGSHSTESGADGAFSVELKAGHYSLLASHPEMRTLREWTLLDGEGSQIISMERAPERTASVFGIVTDQDGQPVSGASVQSYQYGDCCYETVDSEGASSEPAQSRPYYEDNYQETKTAADGSYSLALYPGYVNINAQKEGHAPYWNDFEVAEGDNQEHNFVLEKYPPKTAKIEGRVLDRATGAGLSDVRISVESPRYGIYECSMYASESSNGDSPQSTSPSGGSGTSEPDALYYPGPRDCAITINDDGSFEGTVTPGYTLLSAYHEYWRNCDHDRTSQPDCGPQYLSYSATFDLAPDATTKIDVPMKARPAPDATVSGYVVDSEKQTAIPQVQVQFSNQETYGYAWAVTDADGSYKVALRSGYHQVNVWADGYLRWTGTLDIPANGNIDLDIILQAGQNRYGGGCCYAYAEDGASPQAAGEAHASGAGTDESSSISAGGASTEAGGDASAFKDLGGGLGPYDANARQGFDGTGGEVNNTPVGSLLLVAAIGAALLLRRRL